MKKLIGIGIAAMMVMGLAGAASAAIDENWLVTLRAVNASGLTNGNISCGTKTGAINGYTTAGVEDAAQSTGAGARAFITTDIQPGVLIGKDVRAPFVKAEQPITWALRVWQVDATGAKVAGNIIVSGFISGVANMDIAGEPNVGVKGPWVGDNAGSLDFWFPKAGSTKGTQLAPLFTRTVYYDGINDVQLTLVAVPEPGSMVAMFSGLVGLVGFGIRRRK